jgi:hypothetical protein
MFAGMPLDLPAQQRHTIAAVTVHKDPGGARLARLPDPATLAVARKRAGWTEVVLDGWVSTRLLTPDRREGFDLSVRGDDVRLRAAPNGDEVALLEKGMLVDRVQARSGWTRVRRTVWGDWVRIQTEAWVREGDLKPASGEAPAGVTAAEVRANPERYVGQVLEWRVQYVSTAVADELRPEMPPGQPYVLARGPLPEPGFVYMMVTPEELARIRALPALTGLTVRVNVRAARSRFLATPVVELRALLSPSTAMR